MRQEIRYAFRTLLANPGFALTAILSIAFAIGANSMIYTLANGMLLRPLSVPHPSQVLTLRSVPHSVSSLSVRGYGESRMSYPDFEDFRRGIHSFDGLVAYEGLLCQFGRDPDGPTQFLTVDQVSGDYFRILQVEPKLGRSFRSEEHEIPSQSAVVILSHDLWKNEFGENPAAIGQRIWLNNVPFTIIGVAPEGFTGLDPYIRTDFFITTAALPKLYPLQRANQRTDRSLRRFIVKGRLKPGIPKRVAAQEAAAFAASLEKAYPATNRGIHATVSTEIEMQLVSWPIVGELVAAIFTLAVVILLIACANVGNLMLSRGRARAREIGVRLAVGASRARLVRLLLMESLLIAVASAPLALVAAQSTGRFFSDIDVNADMPIHFDLDVDQHVLSFTVLVSVTSALLFGLVPAIQSTRLDLVSLMKSGETDSGRGLFLGRHVLVVVQIAGAMILLVLAVQGRENFRKILTGNPGFRRDHRITLRFLPSLSGYAAPKARQFYETLAQKATEITGIKSAALTSGLPLTNDRENQAVIPEGYQFPATDQSAEVLTYVVDQNYFDTFGVPLLAGRGFRATDSEDAPPVAVVNEAFAKQYLGPNPIGKKLRFRDRQGSPLEVIGVSMTGKSFLLVEPPVQVLYLPLGQNPRSTMTLVVETTGDPAALASPLEKLARSLDPNIPISRVRTMEDLFERSSVSTIRMVYQIYDFAAMLGLLLALVGLYAVVSYQVGRRTREIGIRIALGADRIAVIRIFVRQAVIMALAGIGAGVTLSLYINRVGTSPFGFTTLDPLLLAAVSLALLLTAMAASVIPARRAARIDPQQALRQE